MVRVLEPKQFAPPQEGAGFVHVLDCCLVPPPHGTLHVVESTHPVHPPLTGVHVLHPLPTWQVPPHPSPLPHVLPLQE